MPEVLTLGECMAILYPQRPVPLDAAQAVLLDIAGAESNLAIGLSRLGHQVSFLSRIGDDSFGRRIRQTLTREGVDTTYLLTDATAHTGVFFREWLPDGERRVYYYRAGSAASHLVPQDLAPQAFTGVRIVHLTGITPALSPACAATVARAIELAHAAGALVSFDLNYRAKLWNPSEARQMLLPLLPHADILLAGHEDVRAIFGVEDDEQQERVLARQPAARDGLIVLRRAERGACAIAGDTRIEVAAYPVSAVVDPVGAGDGFNAGFLAGWLRGYELQASLQLGARIGAAAVSAIGDYTGYPREGRDMRSGEDRN
ncbi:MAG TPA: sugar kinase [Ktedonobacteraceae bacterium]|nr:sugar kinase [Ktedonobacteraceae bacterium]